MSRYRGLLQVCRKQPAEASLEAGQIYIYIYIYVFMYVCMYVYIYIYIYI